MRSPGAVVESMNAKLKALLKSDDVKTLQGAAVPDPVERVILGVLDVLSGEEPSPAKAPAKARKSKKSTPALTPAVATK
jgi:hypothetical protein